MVDSAKLHYTAENYIEEVEKKRMDQWAKLFVMTTTVSPNLVGKPVLFLLLLHYRLLSVLGVMGSFLWRDLSYK